MKIRIEIQTIIKLRINYTKTLIEIRQIIFLHHHLHLVSAQLHL